MLERGINQIVSKVKGFLPKPGSASTAPKENYGQFKSSNDTFKSTYTKDDFLDSQALEKEGEQLDKLYDQLAAEADRTQIVANRPAEAKRWITLQQSTRPYIQVMVDLNQSLADGEDGIQPLTIAEMYTNHILQTGASILAYRSIDQQAAFARRHLLNDTDTFTPYSEFRKFFLTGDITIKFNDISILDLSNKNNLQPHQLFGFVMEALLARQNIAHDKVLAENHNTPYSQQFPNTTKTNIESSSAKVYGLNAFEASSLEPGNKSSDRVFWDVVQTSKDLINKLKSHMRKGLDAYINPENKDHALMVQTLEYYFAQGDTTRLLSIHNLLGSDNGKITEVFRSSRKQSGSLVYEQMASAIYDYIKLLPEGVHCIPVEDLDLIFPADLTDQTPTYDLINHMATTAKTISNHASIKTYTVEPEKVDWDGITPAQAITVEIDKANPTKFHVDFEYESPQGDSLAFWIYFDTKKGGTDWSVLEEPLETPQVRQKFIALTKVSASILDEVERQAQEIANQRAVKRTLEIPAKTTKPNKLKGPVRESQPQEIQPTAKEQKKNTPLTPLQEALQEALTEAAQTDQKNIELPSNEEFIKVSKNLSYSDREIVRSKLMEQNERGVGRLKRLRTPGSNGRPRYSYRVGETRVLLQEIDPENGNRKFTIIDVDYRQSVYKK